MRIDDAEDAILELKEIHDPEDCQNSMSIVLNRGESDIIIEIRGMTSDTREWGGSHILLTVEQQVELYKFIGNHLSHYSVGTMENE